MSKSLRYDLVSGFDGLSRQDLFHLATHQLRGTSYAQQTQLSTPILNNNLPFNTANMPQDMPPTGGYEPVQYKRNLPIRGFRPAYYLVAMGAVMTYGFWRVGQGIREQK